MLVELCYGQARSAESTSTSGRSEYRYVTEFQSHEQEARGKWFISSALVAWRQQPGMMRFQQLTPVGPNERFAPTVRLPQVPGD